MRLRNKILLVVGLTLFALGAGFQLILHEVLSNHFAALEKKAMSRDVQRVEKTILENIDQLSVKASDWARWDDSYNFLESKDETFVESNLTQNSLENLRIDDIVFYDAQGKYFYSAGERIGDADGKTAIRRGLLEILNQSPSVNRLSGAGDSRMGLIVTNDQVSLIAALPILPTDGNGAVRGTIIFSKPLDAQLTEKISSVAEVKLNLIRADHAKADPEISPIASRLRGPKDIQILPSDERTIHGYGMLQDVFGKPAIFVQTIEPRSLYQQGQITLRFLLIGLLISSAIVLSVLLLFIDRLVISRLGLLSKEIADMGERSGAERRVTVNGTDELSSTAQEINSMLDAIGRYEAQLEQAKQAAEAANAARARFVANISHEVRTPVNGILGLTQVLQTIEQSPDKLEYLGMIKASSTSLVGILNDVLDFSKMEAGKLDFENIPFSVSQVIKESLQMISVRAQQRGLEILAEVDPHIPPKLLGDPHRIRQVLLNLANNAMKFTEEGLIAVSATLDELAGDRFSIHWTVTDSGIGMNESALSKIFDAFVQAEGSTARKYGGTGLGLTICKQIVEALGGRIWAESTVGVGTSFHFVTPLEQIPGDTDTPEPVPQGLAVALVDRAPSFLDQMGRNLTEAFGMRISKFSTLDALIESTDPVDAVVIDGTIGDPDAVKLRVTGSPLKGSRIVVTIPSSCAELAVAYRRLSFAAVVLKPVLPSDLARFVAGFAEPETPTQVPDHRAEAERVLNILVADDLPTNQRVLELLLKPRGHHVTLASDGAEVLKLLEQSGYFAEQPTSRFDVILMDSNMPNMDGIQATRAIREKEHERGSAKLPIIVVTASAMVEDKSFFLAHGMDDYIAKPIDADILFQKLRSIEPSAATEHVRWDELKKRFDGSIDFIKEIVECFREEEPPLRVKLAAALESGDGEAIRQAAHAIKASLVNVGARPAAELAFVLEDRGAKKDTADLQASFESLCASIDLVYRELDTTSALDA
ncbi:MAG: CHASE4 domain-containing protein [Bdellovibrionota bacterium]